VIPAEATDAVPARRQITIRDLLTHTAGISYGTDARVTEQYRDKALGSAAGWGWYTADKAEPKCTTMDRLGTLPFVAQPGEAFVYGYNTDTLGCVVERVSGMSLDAFFRARITGPLGMQDTRLFLPEAKRAGASGAVSSAGGAMRLRGPVREQAPFTPRPIRLPECLRQANRLRVDQ